MSDLKTYIETNLLKSNGHLNAGRLKRESFPEELWEQLMSLPGTDIRDRCLIALRGVIECGGCGSVLLPYPRHFGGDKLSYCGKSCMPRAKEFRRDCESCGSPFVTTNEKVRSCGDKACIQELKERTSFKNYGVLHPNRSPDVQVRRQDTCVERYGVDHYSKTQAYVDGVRASMESKFGGHCMRNDEFKSLHASSHARGAEKARLAFTALTGFPSPFDDPKVVSKATAGNMRSVGVSRPFESPAIRAKALESYVAKQSQIFKDVKTHSWWKENYIPGKTSLSFLAKKYGLHQPQLSAWAAQLGIEIVGVSESARHRELLEFLDSIGVDYVSNTRSVIPPLEIDIYIPSSSLAIEVNGSYWHSDERRGSKYHLNKSERCSSVGVRLIHVFDWEDLGLVKASIASACGLVEVVHARRCTVGRIDNQTANQFCKENHIQGACGHSFAYGLHLDGALVMVATLGKPRFNRAHDWELLRMCAKSGTRVQGGASKLIAKILGNHDGTMVSYSRIDKGFNRVYAQCGMKKVGQSDPSYHWCNGKGVSLSRYQTQKHRLPSLLGDGFDRELSEAENMVANGYIKVWDCGNEIFSSEQESLLSK